MPYGSDPPVQPAKGGYGLDPPVTQAQPVDPAATNDPGAYDVPGSSPVTNKAVGSGSAARGAAERVGRELAVPVIGAAQLAQTILPLPGSSRQGLSDIQTSNEKRIKELGGTKLERLAVDTVNPANWAMTLLAPELRAAGIAEQWIPSIIGALSASTQPVESKSAGDFGKKKLEQEGLGAAGGRIGDTVMRRVGPMIAPTLDRARQALTDLGVRLTPGQLIGGYADRIEQAVSSMPFIGALMRTGRQHSVDDFNRAAINEVLAPIGGRLPGGVTGGVVGRPAIAYAQDRLSNAYETLLPNLTLSGRTALADSMRTIAGRAAQLGPTYAADFQTQINRVVGNAFGPQRHMDGATFKEMESGLTQLINDYRASQDPLQKHLSREFEAVRDTMRTELVNQNPRYADRLQDINRAYARLSRVEDASMKTVTPQGASGPGVFMPSSLLRGVAENARRTGRRKGFASGDADMQEFAETGQAVLPRSLPDSGTPERMAAEGLLLGGGAYLSPHTLLGLGVGSTIYTEPVMRAFQNFMNRPGPTRQAASRLVSNAGSYVAPALGVQAAKAAP